MDKSGECWTWTGSLGRAGYATFFISPGEGSIAAHRYSFSLANGPILHGMAVDHMCHVRSCVRPDHLRMATPKQNSENRIGSNASSGVRGVSWRKDIGRWHVQIHADYKMHHIGYFDDLQEAAMAAASARRAFFTFNDEDRPGTLIHKIRESVHKP